MKAGRLRDTIVVQSKSNEQDAAGAEIETFTDVFTAKADVMVVSGVDLLKAGVATGVEVVSILLRLDSRVKYEHMVSWKGNRYEINSIKPDQRKRNTLISASRQIA